MVTHVAIPAAARVLGISIPTVKRRLKSGALPGVQEPTPSGFRWLVEVESPESPPEAPGEIPGGDSTEPPESPGEDSPEPPVESPESPGASLAVQRATDMAQYSAVLLAPYVAQIAAQAERIGRLEEQLAAQQSAPQTGGRSWWRRLVRS